MGTGPPLGESPPLGHRSLAKEKESNGEASAPWTELN